MKRLILAALLALGACTTSTTNGVNTVTLKVAAVDAWGSALTNGAVLVATLPGIADSSSGVAIQAVSTKLAADIAAFDATAGSAVSLTFDSTSTPAAIASLEADAETLLTAANVAIPNVGAADLQIAKTYVAAIQTIVSLVKAAIATTAAAPAPGHMTEAQALAVLHH